MVGVTPPQRRSGRGGVVGCGGWLGGRRQAIAAQDVDVGRSRVGRVVGVELSRPKALEARLFQRAPRGHVLLLWRGDNKRRLRVPVKRVPRKAGDDLAAQAAAGQALLAEVEVDTHAVSEVEGSGPRRVGGQQVPLDDPDWLPVELDHEHVRRVPSLDDRCVVRRDGGQIGRVRPPASDVGSGLPTRKVSEVLRPQRPKGDRHAVASALGAGAGRGGASVPGGLNSRHIASSSSMAASLETASSNPRSWVSS